MTAGALGGVWLFVQSLDKLSTMALNRRKLRAEIEKIELESAKLRCEMSPPMLSVQQIPHAETESDTEPRKTKATKKPADAYSDLILPPAESSRLFNLLRRRGAKKFYDENIQAARNLGFKVEEINVAIDDESQRRNW